MNTIFTTAKLKNLFGFQLLVIALFCLAAANAASAQITFTNSAAITVPGGAPTTTNGPGSPYPSNITVAGFVGNTTKVTVTLTNINHTFPDDIDILLVSPTGQRFVMMSDVGSTNDLVNTTITLDDAAAAALPDTTLIAPGTYRPTNFGTGDTFVAPAPGVTAADNAAPAGTATFASQFNGANPNGIWSLYVVDDTSGDVGNINGGWSLTITAPVAAPAPLIISEFRLRGPNGANDEFVEIYNNGDAPVTVATTDASAGFAVAASDGVIRFTIPNGTVIPGRGHYLGTNSAGYSLGSYPAGNGTTATGDATYTTDIADNAGIALFNTATVGNFSTATRLDAVGSVAEANTLYKEGTGYGTLTPFSIDYSFARNENNLVGCSPFTTDTNNNATDFLFVDTNGTSAGAGQRFGAPGPQNLSSPVRPNQTMTLGYTESLVDTGVGLNAAPNFVRDFTSDPANNSTFGTLSFRRKFTNNTGVPVTRLRFRITNLTTFPSPGGVADLRARTSTASTVTISPAGGGGTASVVGTTLESPPSNPNGGGFNNSLGVGTITLATPLAPGASVNVDFLFGLQQTGSYNIALNIESSPNGSRAQNFVFRGNTEGAAPNFSTVTEPCTLSPTAGEAAIVGRVTQRGGRGIGNVTMTLVGGTLTEPMTARTDADGNYRFENVTVGETYVVTASSSKYKFAQPSQSVNFTGDEITIDFAAQPKEGRGGER